MNDAEWEVPDATPGGADSGAPDVVTLPRAEFEALSKKGEERDRLFEQLQRAVADFDNYQKRVKRDRPAWETERIRRFLLDFLPVGDDLKRLGTFVDVDVPLADVRRVVGLLRDKLEKIFADWKIEQIATEGSPFDPNLHEALREEVTDEVPAGTVFEEVRSGYSMNGAVVRAAQVVVARAAGAADADAGGPEPEPPREGDEQPPAAEGG